MYNLKETQVISYSSSTYKGPAIKLGAGVLTYEALEAAVSHGLRVEGGNCPTVAIAGGYTQGGGHSLLSSTHGMGADNAVEWELVTANGSILTASATNNVDLYWALSGGGPGTYGVVTSLTVKAFEDGIVAGANATITLSPSSPLDFWNVVSLWHISLSTLVDAGGAATWLLSNDSLDIVAVALSGQNDHAVRNLLQPFTDGLERYNVTSSFSARTFSTYLELYAYYFGLPFGDYPSNQVEGGRLFPRHVVETRNKDLTSVLQNITSDSRFRVYGVALNAAHSSSNGSGTFPSNSVLPAWRTTLLHLVITGEWDYTASLDTNHEVEDKLTNNLIPMFEELAPDSGAYVNEGNFEQPNWQQTFYGTNYSKLRAIKSIYDPYNLFYARTGVGSEAWRVGENGALCKGTV